MELDHLADVAEGAGRLVADRDHEQGVVVDLQPGPLVRGDGVLDGQFVEVEFAPDRVELGLVQADPDEGVVGAAGLIGLVEGQFARPSLAVLVDRAVDDHAGIVPEPPRPAPATRQKASSRRVALAALRAAPAMASASG
jgi:hypothetical protein